MNAKDKTVLFIMPRLPFPTISGRKTSLYHYCRILSVELGYRLVVAAFLEGGDSVESCPDFIDRLIILPKASVKERFFNVLFNSILLRKEPLQVALFRSKQASEMVKTIVEEEKPAVAISDMIRTTEYIRDLSCYRIADLDDRISLRYKREYDNNTEDINPYGAFLYSVPKFLRQFMLNKYVKTFVLNHEIELLDAYERNISRVCDSTVFVAKKEAEQLNLEIGENKAISIPNGVDIKYFYFNNARENLTIAFLGALNVSHNEAAVKHFILNIYPIIQKEIPNCELLVIGGGASEELLSFNSDNIHFTGRVDDVRDYLDKCAVFVCPMTFGSGIKTKVLEAMSMGCPVVTTSIGAENIEGINGEDWIIADTPVEFADGVVSILKDKNKGVTIGEKARRFIENNWSWNAAKNAFSALLNKL